MVQFEVVKQNEASSSEQVRSTHSTSTRRSKAQNILQTSITANLLNKTSASEHGVASSMSKQLQRY